MVTPDAGIGITHGAAESVRYAVPAEILPVRIPPFHAAASTRCKVLPEARLERILLHPVSTFVRHGASPRFPR